MVGKKVQSPCMFVTKRRELNIWGKLSIENISCCRNEMRYVHYDFMCHPKRAKREEREESYRPWLHLSMTYRMPQLREKGENDRRNRREKRAIGQRGETPLHTSYVF